MTDPSLPRAGTRTDGTLAYCALACAITWTLASPLALAWSRHAAPPPWALALAGLSALGPTLAALAVAAPRRELGEVFGRWRTNPLWAVIALLLPAALHFPATLVEVALGGSPAQWFYPPVRPEHVAALVVFSVGEEFGWRGFAYPRFVRRHGPVAGSLLLGLVWGLWHLVMMVSPDTGTFDFARFALHLVELPLYCVVFAWIFERGNRSMAVAIALHAGGHLDNVYRAPATEVRLVILRLLVLAVAAGTAARSLEARRKAAGASVPATP